MAVVLMRIPLSSVVCEAAKVVFPNNGERNEVVRLLETECSNNLIGFQNSTMEDEDLQMTRRSVVWGSDGSLAKVRELIDVAIEDWRYLEMY